MKLLLASLLLLASTSSLCAQWNITAPVEKIEGPIKGEIFGVPFVFGKAEWDDVALTIQSKNEVGGWPESELILFMDRDKKEWVITPDKSSDAPHLHMKFAKRGEDFPGTLMFMSEYSMRLKVLEESGDKMKLAIHVSIPDYKKSYLIGQFEVKIVKK